MLIKFAMFTTSQDLLTPLSIKHCVFIDYYGESDSLLMCIVTLMVLSIAGNCIDKIGLNSKKGKEMQIKEVCVLLDLLK